MSYFGRLVEQSHLTVVSPSAGAHSATADLAPVADGLDASASVSMDGDAIDLVEINEIVEAPATPVSAAPRDVPASVPSQPMKSDAVVLAPMSSVVDLPSGRVERESPIARVDAEVVSAPAETASRRDAISAVEGSTYEIAMRRVLEWVAAGPKSDAPPPGVMNTEVPMRAITLAPRSEQAAREIATDSRAATAERATTANASPVIDDVVQVSIGSISVRIEAPAAPAPTAVAPPPTPAAPPRQSPQGSERSTRLARRYLHP